MSSSSTPSTHWTPFLGRGSMIGDGNPCAEHQLCLQALVDGEALERASLVGLPCRRNGGLSLCLPEAYLAASSMNLVHGVAYEAECMTGSIPNCVGRSWHLKALSCSREILC